MFVWCVHSWSVSCVWSRWAVAWTPWPPGLHRRLLTLLLLAATLSVCCGYCKLAQTLIDRYETRLTYTVFVNGNEWSVCGWARTDPSKEIFLSLVLGSGEPHSSSWPTFTLCVLLSRFLLNEFILNGSPFLPRQIFMHRPVHWIYVLCPAALLMEDGISGSQWHNILSSLWSTLLGLTLEFSDWMWDEMWGFWVCFFKNENFVSLEEVPTMQNDFATQRSWWGKIQLCF